MRRTECGHEWTIDVDEPVDQAHGTFRGDTLTDRAALDAIAHVVCDPSWGVGMLEDIGELVRRTGRDLTGDGTSTWLRH